MNIFKRLLKIGQAEIHAFVDQMENPVSMMEQGIRDLKEDLAQSVEGYAKVKALVIRTENMMREKKTEAEAYTEKAKIVLQKAQRDELSTDKAENLAKEALRLKQALLREAELLQQQKRDHEDAVHEMAERVEVLKFNVSKWEKELATLKAKEQVATTAEIVNRHIANIDGNSTIELLEKMKSKVAESEARAAVYAEMGTSKVTIDKSLKDVLEEDAVKSELDELKKQLKQL